MAIRKSMEENLVVKGDRITWIDKVSNALKKAGFTKVCCNSAIYQITGDYKKATIWGEISITLLPVDSSTTKLAIRSTANMDNIYALFINPNQKIISKFKDRIT